MGGGYQQLMSFLHKDDVRWGNTKHAYVVARWWTAKTAMRNCKKKEKLMLIHYAGAIRSQYGPDTSDMFWDLQACQKLGSAVMGSKFRLSNRIKRVWVSSKTSNNHFKMHKNEIGPQSDHSCNCQIRLTFSKRPTEQKNSSWRLGLHELQPMESMSFSDVRDSSISSGVRQGRQVRQKFIRSSSEVHQKIVEFVTSSTSSSEVHHKYVEFVKNSSEVRRKFVKFVKFVRSSSEFVWRSSDEFDKLLTNFWRTWRTSDELLTNFWRTRRTFDEVLTNLRNFWRTSFWTTSGEVLTNLTNLLMNFWRIWQTSEISRRTLKQTFPHLPYCSKFWRFALKESCWFCES